MYMCYFRIVLADPNGFGAPQTVAQSLANDIINPAGPTACTNNPAQPYCFGTEGITESCAKHPATYVHYCTVPQPPNPIRTPMVWVQEAERCDPNMTLTEEEATALVAFVAPKAPGMVVTLYDFTCQWTQGDAFYQATFQIAAGASLDIFTGSSAIVNFINSQSTTLCTSKDPAKRPIFCRDPPLAGNNVCAIDQYDPAAVLICPRSPGNMGVTFALDNCDCIASPGDSTTYKTNILQWMNDITRTTAKLNVENSIAEYKCVQQGSTCQYQYRIRSLPRDDNTDGSVAIQFLNAEITANPRPCSDVSGFSYDFCVPGAYWENAYACSQQEWDRTSPLTCSPA